MPVSLDKSASTAHNNVKKATAMSTLQDVAKASGVSLSTASYALNNGPRALPARTRERVLQAARDLNYHPSALARGMMRKRMNTLGVVFSVHDPAPITNAYCGPILDGIAAAASREHQNAMLFTGAVWSDAEHSLRVFSDGRCDGLVLLGNYSHTDIVPSLLERGIPFVLINNRADDPRVCYVDADDAASAFQMTLFLLEQGHSRIAPISVDGGTDFVLRRQAGFLDALRARGLFADPRFARGCDLSRPLHARLDSLLELPAAERPTALLCMNDFAALDVLPLLRGRGVRVPQDLSLVSFDDLAPAAAADPPLTTMRQPFRVMGERAVEILIGRIQSAEHGCRQELFSTELIVRQSVGVPPPSD